MPPAFFLFRKFFLFSAFKRTVRRLHIDCKKSSRNKAADETRRIRSEDRADRSGNVRCGKNKFG
ncbi:MAG TPA: hypothetical protein DCE65_08110 [Clostridiales bacterium]|nr:hypothetical protein [Clostridiales bacterium]